MIVGIAGVTATGLLTSNASPSSLPNTTPAALIAAVKQNHVSGFSGTVVSHISLGLPELPSSDTTDEKTTFGTLLSGSHTMQVWYGGVARQRVALLGQTDEADLFRNGRQVWEWSSADGIARHGVLPARTSHALASPATLTPGSLAHRALAALNPSTAVTVRKDQTVADRSAYELILTPRSTATKIGSVHIAVDGATKVPLGVQVYPRGSDSAALDVAFTSIRFGAQAERNFVFTPPPNAQVRSLAPSGADMRPDTSGREPSVTGSGWTTVVELRPAPTAARGTTVHPSGQAALLQGPLTKAFVPVSGSWGSGRLLDAPLFSVLISDDGRVFLGAVKPTELYAAAAK